MKRTLFVLLAALMASSAFALEKITINKIKYQKDHFWNDTIGFGSEHPNYGKAEVIGHFNGKPVSFGYDYNYLEHFVWLGDSIVVHNPALLLENSDAKKNTARFSLGFRETIIDFSRPDAIKKLAAFVAPPKGWLSDNITYSMDRVYCDENSDNTQNSASDTLDFSNAMPLDRRIIVVYPSKKLHRRQYFQALSKIILSKEACNFGSFVAAHIHSDDENHITKSAEPNRIVYPMAGENFTNYIFPVYNANGIVTVGETINMTYPAGGCRSSQTSYYCFRLSDGKEILPEDIFNAKYTDKIIRFYLESVRKDITEYGFYNYDDSGNKVPYSLDEVAEKLEIDTNNGLDQIGKIALADNGVIFEYNFADFSDFGEDPMMPVLVPYKELNKFLKPQYRK